MTEETRILLVNNVKVEDYMVISENFYILEKEINRLNNIIDKAKKETIKQLKGAITQEFTDLEKILNILELKEKK